MSHIHDGMLIYSAWKVKSSFNAICGIWYWLKTKVKLFMLIDLLKNDSILLSKELQFWILLSERPNRNIHSRSRKRFVSEIFPEDFYFVNSMWNNVRYIQNRPGVETRWLRRLYLCETVLKSNMHRKSVSNYHA